MLYNINLLCFKWLTFQPMDGIITMERASREMKMLGLLLNLSKKRKTPDIQTTVSISTAMANK